MILGERRRCRCEKSVGKKGSNNKDVGKDKMKYNNKGWGMDKKKLMWKINKQNIIIKFWEGIKQSYIIREII